MEEKLIKGFQPILPDQAKILILGSMPSIKSLEKQEYYGHPSNRFWKIIGLLFKTEFNNYQEKVATLKKHHIALWDIIDECYREGSLDSAIKQEKTNSIEGLLKENPSIQAIFCNGAKSYQLVSKKLTNCSIPIYQLPSTSSANQSKPFEAIYQEWTKITEFL